MELLIDSIKFFPTQRPNSPGSPQLDMIIQDPSNGTNADSRIIKEVSLPMATFDNTPETVILSHPWLHGDVRRVCAGRISLQMVNEDTISVFTFGGSLQVHPGNHHTKFILSSPAPILRLKEFNCIPTLLANETAILLGEIRAKRLPELDTYYHNLVCSDPIIVYCACLKELKEKYRDISDPDMPSTVTFLTFLTAEIRSLKAAKRWPQKVQKVEELL